MKKNIFSLPALVLLVAIAGCTLQRGIQAPLPTSISIPSTTPLLSTPTTVVPTPILPTSTISLPTLSPGPAATSTLPQSTAAIIPTPTTGVVPGAASGPYGVILVTPGDVLNIRTGAGEGYPVAGSFNSTANNIMRTGASSMVGADLWVQVLNPGGGMGWVNSNFLTEYVTPATFCNDSRISALLLSLGNAFNTSDGAALAAQVSTTHGMTIYLWRQGMPHTFKQADARWVFESTYQHNWGSAPAMGMDTIGSFHDKVLPWLQDVFKSNYTLTCNSLGSAAHYGNDPWPVEYANVNFYTVFKPGTPGIDLDFRYWLVGVEYVQGQPTLFALIHFAWEP